MFFKNAEVYTLKWEVHFPANFTDLLRNNFISFPFILWGI